MAESSTLHPIPITALASSSQHLVIARGPYVYSVDHSALLTSSSEVDSSGILRRLDTHGSTAGPGLEGSFVRHVAVSDDRTDESGEVRVAFVSEDKRLSLLTLPPDGPSGAETSAGAAQLWTLIKRASCISLPDEPRRSVLLSDKVGDCFLYPRQASSSSLSSSSSSAPTPAVDSKGKNKEETSERPQTLKLHADPSLNPDATYLLGHTSVLTAHVLASSPPSGPAERREKYLITADRDEHIRVSRYPQAYVVERFLHGTDGFVSSLHIPSLSGALKADSPILISGGGDSVLRLWNWTSGASIGTVDIWPAVLPQRRVRSAMRKLRRGRKVKQDPSGSAGGGAGERDTFLDVPEGWVLPAGRGVCVKRITSVHVGEQTVVLFYSEGCAAVHSFVLPSSLIVSGSVGQLTQPEITTLELPFPVVALTVVPSPHASEARLLVSVDTAFSTVYTNPAGPSDRMSLLPPSAAATAVPSAPSLVDISVHLDGQLRLIDPDDPQSTAGKLARLLRAEETAGRGLIPREQMGKVQLYSDLALLPRWPGMEEDDELAGPPPPGDSSSNVTPPALTGLPAVISDDPASADGKRRGGVNGPTAKGDEYTPESLAKLSLRELGRLKAHGVDVGEEMRRKKRAYRVEGPEKKRGKYVQSRTTEGGGMGGMDGQVEKGAGNEELVGGEVEDADMA